MQDAKRDLYRLELRTNWFNLLHKKSIELAEECNKVSLDMFSSPDDGFPLIIVKGTKTQNGKERVYYDVEAGKPTVGQSWEDFLKMQDLRFGIRKIGGSTIFERIIR